MAATDGPDPRLRWGIVGCGEVVEKKSGPAILQAGGSRIAAVMRRDVRRALPFARAHRIPLCTADAGQVVGHPEVDIVYVATPPAWHREYVLAAARAGKHVLVEKPMGLSAAQDEEMVDACRRAGVELFVAYYRRFHPHVLKMKELIDAGRIGRPVAAWVDVAHPPAPGRDWGWRVQPEISGGGLFVDVVSHRIDLLVYLLGEPEEVCGLRVAPGPAGQAEETAALAVRFGGGALAAVSGDFASARRADRFAVSGTRGTLDAGRLDSHAFSLCADGKAEEFAFDPDPAPHLGLIRHIEGVLAGREVNRSSGAQGRSTDRILDLGYRRIGGGGG
jgi:1,5-anhydro-D-fructose reductase (1,5-anhydro-D-mannitol-forming)